MAALGKKYVAGDVSTEQRDFEDLPAGIYEFEIEASDVIETGPEGNRTGNGLKYTANVRAPAELEGRKFFGFINLENKNAEAQRIGQEDFAKLRRAIGVDEVDDSEDLHLKPYMVKLGMGKPSKKVDGNGQPLYPARMEVKLYYFPDQGDMPEAAVADVQPAKAAPVAANNNRAPAANQNARPAASKPAAAATGGAAKKRPWDK